MYTTSARYTPVPDSKPGTLLAVLRAAGKPLYSCELIPRVIERGFLINVHQLNCLFRPLLKSGLVHKLAQEPKSVWVAADAPIQFRPVCLITHEGSVLDKALTFLMTCPHLSASTTHIHTAIEHSKREVIRELHRAGTKECLVRLPSDVWQLVPDRWLSSNVKTRAAAAAIAETLRPLQISKQPKRGPSGGDVDDVDDDDEIDHHPFMHRTIPAGYWQAHVPPHAARSVFHLGGS